MADLLQLPEGAIGVITAINGGARILSEDNKLITVKAGTPIHLNDEIQTAKDSKLAFALSDETIMTMESSARLIVDDFLWDEDNDTGTINVEVAQGSFSFQSGKVAGTSDDAMMITTPVMTIGVRGTKVVAKASNEGQESKVVLLKEADGTTGAVNIATQVSSVLLDEPNQSTIITSAFKAPASPKILTPAEIFKDFGSSIVTLNRESSKIQTKRKTKDEDRPEDEDKEELEELEEEVEELEEEQEELEEEVEELEELEEELEEEEEALEELEEELEEEESELEEEEAILEEQEEELEEQEEALVEEAEALEEKEEELEEEVEALEEALEEATSFQEKQAIEEELKDVEEEQEELQEEIEEVEQEQEEVKEELKEVEVKQEAVEVKQEEVKEELKEVEVKQEEVKEELKQVEVKQIEVKQEIQTVVDKVEVVQEQKLEVMDIQKIETNDIDTAFEQLQEQYEIIDEKIMNNELDWEDAEELFQELDEQAFEIFEKFDIETDNLFIEEEAEPIFTPDIDTAPVEEVFEYEEEFYDFDGPIIFVGPNDEEIEVSAEDLKEFDDAAMEVWEEYDELYVESMDIQEKIMNNEITWEEADELYKDMDDQYESLDDKVKDLHEEFDIPYWEPEEWEESFNEEQTNHLEEQADQLLDDIYDLDDEISNMENGPEKDKMEAEYMMMKEELEIMEDLAELEDLLQNAESEEEANSIMEKMDALFEEVNEVQDTLAQIDQDFQNMDDEEYKEYLNEPDWSDENPDEQDVDSEYFDNIPDDFYDDQEDDNASEEEFLDMMSDKDGDGTPDYNANDPLFDEDNQEYKVINDPNYENEVNFMADETADHIENLENDLMMYSNQMSDTEKELVQQELDIMKAENAAFNNLAELTAKMNNPDLTYDEQQQLMKEISEQQGVIESVQYDFYQLDQDWQEYDQQQQYQYEQEQVQNQNSMTTFAEDDEFLQDLDIDDTYIETVYVEDEDTYYYEATDYDVTMFDDLVEALDEDIVDVMVDAFAQELNIDATDMSLDDYQLLIDSNIQPEDVFNDEDLDNFYQTMDQVFADDFDEDYDYDQYDDFEDDYMMEQDQWEDDYDQFEVDQAELLKNDADMIKEDMENLKDELDNIDDPDVKELLEKELELMEKESDKLEYLAQLEDALKNEDLSEEEKLLLQEEINEEWENFDDIIDAWEEVDEAWNEYDEQQNDQDTYDDADDNEDDYDDLDDDDDYDNADDSQDEVFDDDLDDDYYYDANGNGTDDYYEEEEEEEEEEETWEEYFWNTDDPYEELAWWEDPNFTFVTDEGLAIPTFSYGAWAWTLNENNANGAVFSTIYWNDEDDGMNNITVSTWGAGASWVDVVLGPSTLTIKANQSFNYEALDDPSNQTLWIKLTDDDSNSISDWFYVSINDVNETPTISSTSAVTLAENVSSGTAVATISASDPDSGATLTYSISAGNGDSKFAINSSTGAITTAASLDYEDEDDYTLTVTVSDGTNSTTASQVVNISNVNETPVAANNTGIIVNEDATLSVSDGASANSITTGAASWDSSPFSVASQENLPATLSFNNDGTKMFVAGNTGDDINEYHLSTAWDVSTASYDSNFDLSSQLNEAFGHAWNLDGTKLFVADAGNGDDINEYTLTTGFDVSTASFVDSLDVSSQDSRVCGIRFNNDGTKLFVTGFVNDYINEYNLSTAFDISTGSYSKQFSVNSQETHPRDVQFNSDGSKMWVVGGNGDDISEYTLSTSFDVSTASYVDAFSVSSQDTNPFSMAFNNDGTKMFMLGYNEDKVHEYSLVSPYQLINVSGEHDGDILKDDTDPDSDSLTVASFRLGATEGSGNAGTLGSALTGTYGQLTMNANGSYSYVANQSAADVLDAGDVVTDSFNYTVSDGNGGTDTATLIITVNGINDAPTLASMSNVSLAESVNSGTSVATASGSDVDDGASLTYSITSGNSAGKFAINSSTGAITTAATLDYETTTSYTLAVQVSDGTETATTNQVVNITDVDEGTTGTINYGTVSTWGATLAEDSMLDNWWAERKILIISNNNTYDQQDHVEEWNESQGLTATIVTIESIDDFNEDLRGYEQVWEINWSDEANYGYLFSGTSVGSYSTATKNVFEDYLQAGGSMYKAGELDSSTYNTQNDNAVNLLSHVGGNLSYDGTFNGTGWQLEDDYQVGPTTDDTTFYSLATAKITTTDGSYMTTASSNSSYHGSAEWGPDVLDSNIHGTIMTHHDFNYLGNQSSYDEPNLAKTYSNWLEDESEANQGGITFDTEYLPKFETTYGWVATSNNTKNTVEAFEMANNIYIGGGFSHLDLVWDDSADKAYVSVNNDMDGANSDDAPTKQDDHYLAIGYDADNDNDLWETTDTFDLEKIKLIDDSVDFVAQDGDASSSYYFKITPVTYSNSSWDFEEANTVTVSATTDYYSTNGYLDLSSNSAFDDINYALIETESALIEEVIITA